MKMNTTDYLYVDICFVSIYVIKHISNLRMALKERSKKKKNKSIFYMNYHSSLACERFSSNFEHTCVVIKLLPVSIYINGTHNSLQFPAVTNTSLTSRLQLPV